MNELFQKYADAFDSFDALAISNLYTLPCSASDGDGAQVFINRKSLISKFNENCLSMKSMGYKHSSFNILSEIDMGDVSKAVNIGWRVTTSKGEVEFRSLYICHKISSQWLIFSANVYQGAFINES